MFSFIHNSNFNIFLTPDKSDHKMITLGFDIYENNIRNTMLKPNENIMKLKTRGTDNQQHADP